MFVLLRETTPPDIALADRHTWPARYSVTLSADASDAKVFVMRTRPPGEFVGDTFSCIASAQQMTDLPEDEAGSSGPFFRTHTITLLCRSAAAALEFDEKVKSALQDLADNLSAAEQLTVAETTTILPYV